jgi:predicted transcriptional regulator
MVDKMNLKKIELYMDKIIQNEEIEDAMDWMVDLLTQLADEKYEFCAKIRDVIEITTRDMERLIKMKNVDEDEKQELLMELKFIYDLYQLSVIKILEDEDV